MRSIGLWLAGLLLCSLLVGAQEQRERVPPGIRSAMQKQRPPTEPPVFEPQRSAVNIAQLKRDAEELAQLALSIPQEIEQVGRGLRPKDLDEKLKHIEKLSRRIHSQLHR